MPNIISKVKSTGAPVKSITFDNGSEFRRFGSLELMGVSTYFCNPGSPWEKGQVERTNAVLHKFIPKRSLTPLDIHPPLQSPLTNITIWE